MRAAYVSFLNRFPLVVPAAIFSTVFFPLAPLLGPYAAVIALLVAARLTAYW